MCSIQIKMDRSEGLKKAWITRRKNGNANPWNKGKKGLQVAWNKGLTKEDNESISKMGFRKGHGDFRSEDGIKAGAKKISGNNHPFFGKKRPPQMGYQKGHPTYISKETYKIIGKKNSGKNNCNWKGGISSKNDKARHNAEMSLWRKSILIRDNFTCQKYGIRGGKLQVHHINNFSEFPELRTAISNGITLSEKAHKEFHKIYSRKNNTQEQLNEFFQYTA